MCSTRVSVIPPEILSLLKKLLWGHLNIWAELFPLFWCLQRVQRFPGLTWKCVWCLHAYCKCVIYVCISVHDCPRLCSISNMTLLWNHVHLTRARLFLHVLLCISLLTTCIHRDGNANLKLMSHTHNHPHPPTHTAAEAQGLLQIYTNGPWWNLGHTSATPSVSWHVFIWAASENAAEWRDSLEVKNRRNSPFADERMFQCGEGSVGQCGFDNSAKSCNLAWYYTQSGISLSLSGKSHIQHSYVIIWGTKKHRSLSSSCQTEAQLPGTPSCSFDALRAGIAGIQSHLPENACKVVKSADAQSWFRLEVHGGAAKCAAKGKFVI